MSRFSRKVALIAGAGDGLGRAAALAFSRNGATVVLAGPPSEDLEGTVKLLHDEGGEGCYVLADITDPDSDAAARMVDAAVRRYGTIDIAFNNATVTFPPTSVADICETDWTRTLAANLTGVWMAMKHEIAHMERHGGGVIVNTACNLASNGLLPGLGAYAASKAALATLTRTAAGEYAAKGIRINAISPGPGHEPGEEAPTHLAFPQGKSATAEEVAETVVWLCSAESGFLIGHDLVLDRKAASLA